LAEEALSEPSSSEELWYAGWRFEMRIFFFFGRGSSGFLLFFESGGLADGFPMVAFVVRKKYLSSR
jgi:hypothetical protein